MHEGDSGAEWFTADSRNEDVRRRKRNGTETRDPEGMDPSDFFNQLNDVQ